MLTDVRDANIGTAAVSKKGFTRNFRLFFKKLDSLVVKVLQHHFAHHPAHRLLAEKPDGFGSFFGQDHLVALHPQVYHIPERRVHATQKQVGDPDIGTLQFLANALHHAGKSIFTGTMRCRTGHGLDDTNTSRSYHNIYDRGLCQYLPYRLVYRYLVTDIHHQALSAGMPASLVTCCSLDASLPAINTIAPLLLISLATRKTILPVAPVINTCLPFKVSISLICW